MIFLYLYLSTVLLTYWVIPRWLNLYCLLVESRTPCVKDLSPTLGYCLFNLILGTTTQLHLCGTLSVDLHSLWIGNHPHSHESWTHMWHDWKAIGGVEAGTGQSLIYSLHKHTHRPPTPSEKMSIMSMPSQTMLDAMRSSECMENHPATRSPSASQRSFYRAQYWTRTRVPSSWLPETHSRAEGESLGPFTTQHVHSEWGVLSWRPPWLGLLRVTTQVWYDPEGQICLLHVSCGRNF